MVLPMRLGASSGKGPASVCGACKSGHVFVGGFPVKDLKSVQLGGLPVLHLSRICLGTTRTTTGLGSGASATGCLGRVVGGHASSAGRLIARSATALREILLRHHGRLMNRKRHFFSTVHGGRAMAHCAGRSRGN